MFILNIECSTKENAITFEPEETLSKWLASQHISKCNGATVTNGSVVDTLVPLLIIFLANPSLVQPPIQSEEIEIKFVGSHRSEVDNFLASHAQTILQYIHGGPHLMELVFIDVPAFSLTYILQKLRMLLPPETSLASKLLSVKNCLATRHVFQQIHMLHKLASTADLSKLNNCEQALLICLTATSEVDFQRKLAVFSTNLHLQPLLCRQNSFQASLSFPIAANFNFLNDPKGCISQ